ncbi:gas vesicle protein GvpG [Streptomyces malaysiensis]|uniref:Gas vesicle synthesis protein n=1 Tax=Streptomyces malaysiensis TaxID=92644 RepID=A0A7X6B0J3_STRMQ|nr:gas vesicle protein GvpG [Streptomyces malaysiensis]NIY69594.1 gas vesicle synthesis protein [Streptomyces malaysiensis]
MGLLTGLLTLPLAPVRTAVWVAEQMAAAAELEYYDPEPVRRALAELERDLLAGRIDEDEYDRRENELLDRLDRLDERRRAP